MDIEKAIRAVVLGEFESAAATFNTNPKTEAWSRLEAAMWARQAITSTDSMEKAVKQLPGLGIGDWIKHLRAIHEGKVGR